jgi:diphosphomevalonate decarboxylase
MRPGTVAIIEEVRAFRRDTETPVCFTLDAGANVHLLYPENVEQKVNTWVNEVLSAYCNKRYLCDQVGNGPRWKSSV